jgi:hypothetical protein
MSLQNLKSFVPDERRPVSPVPSYSFLVFESKLPTVCQLFHGQVWIVLFLNASKLFTRDLSAFSDHILLILMFLHKNC